MPIPTVIMFGIALIGAIVMAVGWLQDPVAPMPWNWFIAKMTEGGLWSGIFLSLLAAAYFSWRASRGNRKAKGPS